MIRPRTLLIALSLLAAMAGLVGCASGRAATTPTSSSSAPTAGTASGSATTSAPKATASGSAAPISPTKTSLMVCGPEIKGQVKLALKLTSLPKTTASYADGRYSCRYDLPMGPMVLSVQHSVDDAGAKAYFTSLRTTMAPTEKLLALGVDAFSARDGIAVTYKDNETLVVDATKLPKQFGPDQQRRSDLAYEIATDVMGCWTGTDHYTDPVG